MPQGTYILITKDVTNYSYIDPYIFNKITYLTSINKHKLRKKIEVVTLFPDISLTIPVIFDYIYKDVYNLKDVEILILLENFLLEHTDIEDIIMFNIFTNIKFNKKLQPYILYTREKNMNSDLFIEYDKCVEALIETK